MRTFFLACVAGVSLGSVIACSSSDQSGDTGDVTATGGSSYGGLAGFANGGLGGLAQGGVSSSGGFANGGFANGGIANGGVANGGTGSGGVPAGGAAGAGGAPTGGASGAGGSNSGTDGGADAAVGSGGGSTDGGSSACDTAFGNVDGYVLCSSTATDCTFYTQAAGGPASCDDVCNGVNKTCTSQVNNQGGTQCTAGGTAESCGMARTDQICTCSLGGGSTQDAGGNDAACNGKFGAASGYVLCSSTATNCTFYTSTNGGGQNDCATVCTDLGGTCTSQVNNQGTQGGAECTPNGGTEACTMARGDQICTCAF